MVHRVARLKKKLSLFGLLLFIFIGYIEIGNEGIQINFMQRKGFESKLMSLRINSDTGSIKWPNKKP